MRDGLYVALKLAEGQPRPGVVVLLTDGIDTISWLSEDEALRVAREHNAVVHVVALAGRTPFLRELADATGGRLFTAEWKDLTNTFEQVLAEMRQAYRLAYEPSGVPSDGWHRLHVRLKGRAGEVRARRGYLRSAKP
jgi:VWFA-related protein